MRRALPVLLALAACAPKEREAALHVIINLDPAITSTHVQLTVTSGGATRRTTPMKTADKTFLEVAVAQGTFADEVTLEAVGYTDETCTTETSPPERAAAVTVRFVKNRTTDVTLALLRQVPDAGVCDGDCAKPECDGQPCSTSNLCLAGLRCSGGACQGGTPVACGPAPACYTGTGACQPGDGGCVWAVLAGGDCDTGDYCSVMGKCQGTGACVGAPRTCNTPPAPMACWEGRGECSDGGCRYRPRDGGLCDDGDDCTVGDGCQGDGGCAGRRVSCEENECRGFLGSCEADAGCRFAFADAGLGCDGGGGVCNGGGACVPTFPYRPSNFTEVDVPTPPSQPVVFNCGETVIDTGASGAPSVTNPCPGMPPFGWRNQPQPDGPDALLISFTDLDVGPGGTLRLIGVRPAIIVATGRVRVLTSILTEAGAQSCADGGVGGDGQHDGTIVVGGNGSAGGGGFGTAGALGGNSANDQAGGPGGLLNGEPALVPLRGGCPGGKGGDSPSRISQGGGALQISAAGELQVVGVVAAPGKPGAGGELVGLWGGGANGGGSGGGVLLEALRLTVTSGAITANGGGGGEGAGALSGNPAPPTTTTSALPSAGGRGNSPAGGEGGDGGAGTVLPTQGDKGSFGASGGAGGGAVGRIRVNTVSGCSVGPTAVFSPPPTSLQADAGCP